MVGECFGSVISPEYLAAEGLGGCALVTPCVSAWGVPQSGQKRVISSSFLPHALQYTWLTPRDEDGPEPSSEDQLESTTEFENALAAQHVRESTWRGPPKKRPVCPRFPLSPVSPRRQAKASRLETPCSAASFAKREAGALSQPPADSG